MIERGFILIHRKIWKNPTFKKKAMSVGLLVWLVQEAAWKATKILVGNAIIEIQRGQIFHSQRYISEQTGVPRQQLRTLLRQFERVNILAHSPTRPATQQRKIITICNYDKYQFPETPTNPTINPASTQPHPKEERTSYLPSVDKSADNAGAREILDDEKSEMNGHQDDKPKPQTGAYITADWKPREDEIMIWVTMGMPQKEIDDVAEEFRDFWMAQAGQGARKRNWDLTFRNWIKNLARHRGVGTGKTARSNARRDNPGDDSIAAAVVRRQNRVVEFPKRPDGSGQHRR